MPHNAQNDRELNTFGFVTSKLRTGLITAFLAMQTIAIIVLFRQNASLNERLVEKQDELYRKTIEYLREPVNKINQAATKVDTVAAKVDSATQKIIDGKR